MEKIIGRGWPLGLGTASLLLAMAYQLYCTFQPLSFLLDNVVNRDDVFYYFAITRNIAEQGWATFDGIHSSNGVQLLWAIILVPFAAVFQDDVSFIRAALVLCVLLNGVAGFLFLKIGKSLQHRELGDIAVFFWAGFMFELGATLQGIEFPLHIVIILATLLMCWKVIDKVETIEIKYLVSLSILLTLNFWTRLDSVLFSVFIWAVTTYFVFRRPVVLAEHIRAVAALTLIPALGAGAYMATSYAMAETLLPISGSVKAWYGDQFFTSSEWRLRPVIESARWHAKIHSFQFLNLLPANLLPQPPSLSKRSDFIIPALAITISLLGLWRIFFTQATDKAVRRMTIFLIVLWGVSVIHIAIIVWSIADFSHVTRHYYGWLIVAWFFWGALLLALALDLLRPAWRPIMAYSIAIIFAGSYGLLAWGRAADSGDQEILSTQQARMRLTPWIEENLPEDAIIGSWNSGQLGFFVDRPVVNLDGLANDRDFLEFMRSEEPLRSYLKATGITHLVDYNERDLSMRYGAKWDKSKLFRDVMPWDEVEVLHQEAEVYVLKLRN